MNENRRISVASTLADNPDLQQSWDEILLAQSGDIKESDVTASFEWAQALEKVQLDDKQLSILILKDGGHINGILPLYHYAKTVGKIQVKAIAPVTEEYSGRTGFVLRDFSLDILNAFFEKLNSDAIYWDVMQLTLVDGSKSDLLFKELVEKNNLSVQQISSQASPYFVVEGTWPDYFSSLKKRFRENIKRDVRKLDAAGEVTYEEYISWPESQSFFDDMITIEKGSWKEDSGTSITQHSKQEEFYYEFLKAASRKGWFRGQLLRLNGEPITYNYGALLNGNYIDLKGTFIQEYRHLAPGNVLAKIQYEKMFDEDVKYYDFMGDCDDYKMRWARHTYERSTYLIFNNTVKGKLASAACRLLQKLKAPQPTS